MLNELARLLDGLPKSSTITVSSNHPYLKTVFLELVTEAADGILPVNYFDFDLQFSSWVHGCNEDEVNYDPKKLIIPRRNSVSDSIVTLLSDNNPRPGGYVILDSLNTFQAFLRASFETRDTAKANHMTAIYLTLFQQHARKYSKQLLISNISKARPHFENGAIKWDREIVGGRMVLFKTDYIIVIESVSSEGREMVSGKMSVRIVDPSNRSPIGMPILLDIPVTEEPSILRALL